MTSALKDNFYQYYTRELSYLRQAGHLYAQKHPQVAKRLDLCEKESSDPHTERLLESFAFMHARLSQHIDNSFGETAEAVFQVLYPHLLNPLPAMTIAHFAVDQTARLTKAHKIPAGAPLHTLTAQNFPCRFKTVYDLTLHPIALSSIGLIHALNQDEGNTQSPPLLPVTDNWYLKLTLTPLAKTSCREMNLEQLTFHLTGDQIICRALYEALFSQTTPILYGRLTDQSAFDARRATSPLKRLPQHSLKALGFSPAEMAIPVNPAGTHAHALVQEFFHFPEKFMFFQIENLKDLITAPQQGPNVTEEAMHETLELYISLNSVKALRHLPLTVKNILLGCTPIINLFHKVTDPLRLDHRKTHYHLSPDQRRDSCFEIYSIESVISTEEQSNKTAILPCYYSMNFHQNKSVAFWSSKRVSADVRGLSGTDIMLSFVDLSFNPKVPPARIIYANTLCTNRALPADLLAQSHFELEGESITVPIRSLGAPVFSSHEALNGETLWRMVSLLATDHMPHIPTTQGQKASLDTLKERLYLYAQTTANSKECQAMLETIVDMWQTPVARRLPGHSWKGFVRGNEIHLMLRKTINNGGYQFLLAFILKNYFSLQSPINSFIEFVLHEENQEGEWMRWEASHGITTLQ